MKVGAFELREPLPDLSRVHTLAVLRPWIDVGNAGTLTLSSIETQLGAVELGRLSRPGNFFDFTRYRPVLYLQDGHRHVRIPNTTIKYAKRVHDHDFLFLHLLEPHMMGEAYVDSVLNLLKIFGAQRYCLIGGMYDMVPHTKPLIVTGGSPGEENETLFKQVDVKPSDYEGPTTITYLIAQQAWELGIETMFLIVHLPQYAQVEDSYMAKVRLMEVLSALYGFPVHSVDVEKADQQRKDIDLAINKEPELKAMVAQLERHYDARVSKEEEEYKPVLSPEVESFLQDIDRRFRDNRAE